MNWATDRTSLEAIGVFAAIFVLAALLAPYTPCAWRAARRFLSACGKSWGFAALAASLAIYGSVKPAATAEFRFDEGLVNNGSWQTNNSVHVAYSHSAGMADWALHVDAQPKPATNGTAWVRVLDSTVGAQPFDFTWQNASNFVFLVWSEYVEPPVVHTNGVYQMGGVFRSAADTNEWVAPRIPIKEEADGRDFNGGGR